MLVMLREEVCYEILVYKSKLPLFREFNFLKKDIYVNKGTEYYEYIFFIKFNYLIEPNILQSVFDFITYSIVA